MWMPTYTMTCWQDNWWQVFFTSWTRHQTIGTLRSKQPSRLLRRQARVCLLGSGSDCGSTFNSQFPSVRRATSLVTTSQLSTALPGLMQSSISDTMPCPFTECVRWIASGFVSFTFLDGAFNLVDILSKHWGYQQVWQLIFFGGNTADLYEDD